MRQAVGATARLLRDATTAVELRLGIDVDVPLRAVVQAGSPGVTVLHGELVRLRPPATTTSPHSPRSAATPTCTGGGGAATTWRPPCARTWRRREARRT